MANETRAHIALVTGDLITTARDPLDSCLDGLKTLRADAGVFGCMGNHEAYARVQQYVEQAGARQGLRFLRGHSQLLRFGDARLNLAGVDYQPLRSPYLRGAEKLTAPTAYNVLLSHNPDVFDVAARQGYDLTISGHTHGGQVRVEILGADLNVARFFTPYVDGFYSKNRAAIFVSRGLGTIGIPARLGAPPEVTLLRLCRI
jgi:predicted MPP superfamily phosphohydrolase